VFVVKSADNQAQVRSGVRSTNELAKAQGSKNSKVGVCVDCKFDDSESEESVFDLVAESSEVKSSESERVTKVKTQ